MKRLWTAISTIALVTGALAPAPALAQTSTSASGSNAGAVSGSASDATANPVQTTNTVSGSVSGSTAGSSSNASSNPINTTTTTTTTNSTSGSNANANSSTNSAASNQGNSQTINNNSVYPANQTIKTAPAVVAPALTTTLTETCMGSSSMGVSVLGFGATGGTTWQDHHCVRRLNARELAQTIGDRDAARELMCADEEVFKVYNALGRPCRLRPDGSPNPAFVAPPPSPVQPAPAPSAMVQVPGPYVVFFDWNKADITAEAAATLDKASSSYQQTGAATVQLAGHADRTGAEAYNRELSLRRAEAVKAYMSGRGVPREVMVVQGFGSAMPRVSTPEGVREPQNRRVEITFMSQGMGQGAPQDGSSSGTDGAVPTHATANM